MAVAAKAWGAEVGNTNATLVVPTPSGWAAGDALIVALCCQNASAADWDAVTNGWTRIGPAYVANDSNARTTGLYIRFPSSTPPASYTFATPSNGARIVGRMGLFSGIDPNNPVSGSTTWYKGGASATSFTLPGAGAVGGAFNLLEFTGQFASPNSYALTSNSASSWLSNQIDAASPSGAENTGVSRTAIHLLYGTAPAGSVADITLTTAASGARSIFMVSLAPVAAPVVGSGSLGGTGTLSATGAIPPGNSGSIGGTGTLSATATPQPVTTASLGGTGTLTAWTAGYASVAQMLAQPTFYAAHRGGSRDYPEMSMLAYQQSAARGYPALELSLARTSDGVWFGLHDASLDRTSLGTGGGSGTTLVASSMTWAQVQQYKILGSTAGNNPTQPDQPYARLDDILALFPNHVIFVDPKAAYAFRSELLDILDAQPNTPRGRFVGKYFGVDGGIGNTGWAKDCAARGYKTWGYFYESNQPDFATYVARWDILGMDYGASQASWDALLAAGPGKPVMAHIMPTQADVTTGLSKLSQAATNTGTTPAGRGGMVSGVNAVTPAAPAPLVSSSASFGGTGSLTTTASARPTVTATLGGVGALTAASTGGQAATAALGGTGTLTTAASASPAAVAALSGTGSLAATTSGGSAGTAGIGGTGTLTGTSGPAVVTGAGLGGAGQLSATASVTAQFAAAFGGTGTLTAVGTATFSDVTYWYPDSEREVARLLAAKFLPSADHAGSSTPANLEQILPFCQVVRYGGGDDGLTDAAALDVDWYAATRAEASDLARRGHQYLTSGRLATETALIDEVTATVGVVERPRPGGTIRRFGGSYTVSARRVQA